MALPHPQDAFEQLAHRLSAVGVETVVLREAIGRILAENVLANRDSPPFDCSNMDGFAVRLSDVTNAALPVQSEARIGQASPVLQAHTAVRVSTGSPIPIDADAVIPIENVTEQDGRIKLTPGAETRIGDNIRRRGENAAAGSVVAKSGAMISAPMIAAMAAFGKSAVEVHRVLRVAVITTGDELPSAGELLTPWRIADSNSPALCAAIAHVPWLALESVSQVADEKQSITKTLAAALEMADVVLTTGGVSKGHRDFMPDAVRSVTAEIIFHRLPIKPGGPVLGALAGGKALFGLPGNPVSVLVLWRRFVLPCLAHYAGCKQNIAAKHQVELTEPLNKPHEKWNYRLVRIVGFGQAELIRYAGSGDIPAAAASDGFVEVPPNVLGRGPFPFVSWSIA
ncbi:MAG TPA: molybdopterin molybdotransferase MoeA [Phycisphaerae bacterium]|nr:molybdopterin molybdotransferase MoeA [Phycisphaerae bacterium]